MSVQSRKTGSANRRSKSGCLTCRSRKVKCDEAKPACLTCTRLILRCDYASEEAVCLHDRRLGAGPIKKRQFTSWRPQRIEPKNVLSTQTASALAASIPPSVPLPGTSVPSLPSTITSLSPPSIATSPPYDETAVAGANNSNTYSLSTFPTPASEYADFRAEDTALAQETGLDMAVCVPITSTPDMNNTAGLEFPSFFHDNLLETTSMRTPSPFSFIPNMDNTEYMFFGDLSATLSPILATSTLAMGTPCCTTSTPITVEKEASDPALCANVTIAVNNNSSGNGGYTSNTTYAYDLLSASTPSPLANIVLGTKTMVLTSFPSRVRLTDRDYEALVLFRQQIGFSIGSKSPDWSTHAVLIKLAIDHSAILHFLLAASFGELSWRSTAESGNASVSSTGGLASLSASTGTASTSGQLARRHYEAGHVALKELVATPHGTDQDGYYHVVVVACFWLEYLIKRRHVPLHGRWASDNEFSRAIGSYMRKYRLRRNLMGREASFSSSTSPVSSLSPSLPSQPLHINPSVLPVKCSLPDDKDGAISDEDYEMDEQTRSGTKKDMPQTRATEANTAATATKPSKDTSVVVTRPMPPAKYRSFLSRLLCWLYWHDCSTSFFGKGGSLAMQFRQPRRSQPRFYETARTTLLDFWDDYTPEEIADDNQNWPALQLINETWVAVHRLNVIFQAEDSLHPQDRRRPCLPPSFAGQAEETVSDIARDVCALRTRYTTVFRLSAFAANSGGHRSRLLAMADWAVSHYLALELHLLRAGASHADLYGDDAPLPSKELATIGGDLNYRFGYNSHDSHPLYPTYPSYPSYSSHQSYQNDTPPSPTSHPQAIAAQIIHLAERAIRTVGSVELDRFQWPLFWAGIETDNHVYQYFVLSNLINNDLHAALQAVLRERASVGGIGGASGSGSSAGGPGIACYSGSRVSIQRLRAICRAAGTVA
ncbi:hypothetical protein SEPCBS57363_004603 [Sporothrix epigloea]|uniref:Zn(2)-C6 fungal-type domain-containing protein n=1 Tax=Sporothrix epigloea TaxID=1892477 RepID=A0ABP0DV32_9PEZI